MNGDSGRISILVVCDGNVCRSPTAHMAIAENLPFARVESAGMHSHPGMAMCDLAAKKSALEHPTLLRSIVEFRSRAVAEVDLVDFDLILAATKQLRSDLVRLRPGLRDRVFTLREAAHLLRSGAVADTLHASIETVVRSMDGARGTVPLEEVEPRRRGKNREDPFDIVDAHGSRGSRHEAAITAAETAGTQIGVALASIGRSTPGFAESDASKS
jgi:protein-tyrosine phosphatase